MRWFGKKKPVRMTRGFVGARSSAMAKFNATYQKINGELRGDYVALTLRARDLAKNNEIVCSFLSLMIRNVIGRDGFTFAETAYKEDGSADRVANRIIEDLWWNYGHSHHKYVSADGQMNEVDFDRHVLFNFLVDGEAFIRCVKDSRSKYGVRFEVIDALDVDYNQNMERDRDGYRVVMGVKVDAHYRPISYFVRKNPSADYYLRGETEEVPASEIIHVYRKNFAGQVRGYTPLAACIQCLAGLETYKNAEISASLLNAAYMGVWEKTGSGNAYDAYDESEIDSKGDVATELETNVFRYAPEGYSLKNIQSNHPNSNVGAFFKSMIKGVASALGVSSNKLNSDYESVNYSSLRQANSEDVNAWRELQGFLISSWKDVQFAEWLKCVLLSDLTNLPYSRYDKFLSHDFRGRSWEYLDPAKEYAAIRAKLEMRLTNPIIELEKQGLDVDDVLDGWTLWRDKLAARGLPETLTGDIVAPDVDETAIIEGEDNNEND